MYEIDYNFGISSIVWIVDGGDILDCIISQIILEVDPDGSGGIQQRITYHLDPRDSDNRIFLRPEGEVFESLNDAIAYLNDNTFVPVSHDIQTIEYGHAVEDTVWTFDIHTPLECRVIQITFDVELDNQSTIYHVLPTGGGYKTLLRSEENIFQSQGSVIDFIDAIINEITPTPTVTPTNTVTPNTTVTPTVTATVTPSYSS